jgi:hypothetical protein
MTHPLICHSSGSCPAVQQLSIAITALPNKNLHLAYHLQADMQYLRIPETQTPAMTDGLWEHTCFELFIGTEGDSAYQEFNFSPSGQWANYLFSDYRQRRTWQSDHVYWIDVEHSDTDLQMNIIIPYSELALLDTSKTMQIGITAVLETTNGELSYWALHHPTKAPNFHHRGGFIYSFAPHTF